ncbi:polysaccharide deacetylase family protein [Bacillus sp. DJP31]|uniref:polysaccharide deacetylase family protein n=1 Tax=Bacillus sp. DJP31 TaxID=3409789 RepID=UPI003BB6FC30
MKRLSVQLFAISSILLLTLGSVQNPFTSKYVSQLKQSSIVVSKNVSALYLEIEERASEYEKAPQDAVIDKVWKATPGYNGLKVDIDASFRNMEKSGSFDPKQLIFKETSPSIHLNDLPAEPIYKGHPEKKMVSFIINVAWGNDYLPPMLETLKKHKVKATFFLEGRWVKSNPDLAKMIVDAGHEVGNHSYTHPNLKTLTTPLIREQLTKTNNVIEATTSQKPLWFAPPSGSYRQDVVDVALELNMRTVMWSVDTVDWQKPTPSVLINRVMTKIHPGAIILMHPTEATVISLDTLITKIKEKQYKIGSVTNLLNEKRTDTHPFQN